MTGKKTSSKMELHRRANTIINNGKKCYAYPYKKIKHSLPEVTTQIFVNYGLLYETGFARQNPC
jgi:hypothetical protein